MWLWDNLIRCSSCLPEHLLIDLLYYRAGPDWRGSLQFGVHLVMEDPVCERQFEYI